MFSDKFLMLIYTHFTPIHMLLIMFTPNIGIGFQIGLLSCLCSILEHGFNEVYSSC